MLFQDSAGGTTVICGACKKRCTVPQAPAAPPALPARRDDNRERDSKTFAPSKSRGIQESIGSLIRQTLLVLMYLAGIILFLMGIVGPSSEYGSRTVNLDLLFQKLIFVTAGGVVLICGLLIEILRAIRRKKGG